jgi:hypothetical protein
VSKQPGIRILLIMLINNWHKILRFKSGRLFLASQWKETPNKVEERKAKTSVTIEFLQV